MHAEASHANGANGRGEDPEIALRLLEGLSPLVGATCVRKLAEAAARLAAELLEVKACSILLYDPKHRALRLYAATHIPELEWESIRVDPAEGLIGSVFKSGKSALLQDARDFARFGREPSSRYGAPSCIVSPIRIDGRTRGIINISNASSGRIFTSYDLRLIEAASRIIAAGIQHAEEYQESVRVHDRLEEILESARRRGGLRSGTEGHAHEPAFPGIAAGIRRGDSRARR
jgi:GAF domain-containing protein